VVKSKTFPYSHRIKGLKIWQRINSLLCNYISMKGVKSICRKGSNLLTINSIQKCSQKIFGFCLIDKRQTNTFFLLTCLKHYTIKTNVSGFAALVNVAMHHFTERGSGHLVGISSIAALRGGRESPAYNASKAFESNYLEGLRQKVRKSRLPITITDIKPGFVNTAMAKGEGIFWAAEPERAASQIYHVINRRKSSAYITRRWALVAWLIKLLPGFIYERL